jgi:transcriptional antiterminator RfaH
MTDSSAWFALYTKPHKEYLVKDLLHNLDVEVYLPEIPVASPRRGRRRAKPFFPHYLFARFDMRDGVAAKIRYTPGVRRIVSAGGRPVPVADEVVGYIRRRLSQMEACEPEGPFKKGDQVRVISGPFEGLEAIFDRQLSPRGRVRVFLGLMGRLVATDMEVGDLLPPE